jgi:hypothetical protein
MYINTKIFLYLDMEKDTKNYILANIKIPMEINEDGSFETLPDYLTILFENLKELPSPSDNDYNNEYIKQQIKSLLNNNNNNNSIIPPLTEIIPTISQNELNNRKNRHHKKNITFKKKPSSINRFTAKNYSSLQTIGESIGSMV